MAGTRIATTRFQDLQALVTGGQSTLDAWSMLHSLLTGELSAEHAALLAEPVANPTRGETDWYSELAGPAVPLPKLSPDQRSTVQATLSAQVAEIETLIDRLRASQTDSDRLLGELLALALHIPGDDSICTQNGRPVLVAWGHARSGPEAASVTLVGRRQVEPRPMTILPPPAPSLLTPPVISARWPIVALVSGVLAALLVLFALLHNPFGWFDIATPACRVAQEDTGLLAAFREEEARGAVLRGTLADVIQDAGRRRQMCPPVAGLPPEQPAGSHDVQRAHERGAHSGRLQIILAWDDRNDLDLHVVCPNGTEIGFGNKSACGGVLDIDANGPHVPLSNMPVENVSFTTPAPGRYQIFVDPYQQQNYDGMRVSSESSFRITIRREGMPDEVVTGVAHRGQRRQFVTSVEVAPP